MGPPSTHNKEDFSAHNFKGRSLFLDRFGGLRSEFQGQESELERGFVPPILPEFVRWAGQHLWWCREV